jgi:hypothetical protein
MKKCKSDLREGSVSETEENMFSTAAREEGCKQAV